MADQTDNKKNGREENILPLADESAQKAVQPSLPVRRGSLGAHNKELLRGLNAAESAAYLRDELAPRDLVQNEDVLDAMAADMGR